MTYATVYRDDVLALDFDRCRVWLRGQEVRLTYTEYELLAALVAHAGRPLHPERLQVRIWGPDNYRGPEHVKWHVRQLRQKVEHDPGDPQLIVTRRGFGYSYEGESPGGHHVSR